MIILHRSLLKTLLAYRHTVRLLVFYQSYEIEVCIKSFYLKLNSC